MSTLPEQFSAARKTQVEAQLEFFRKLSSKAVESTEKVIALNLSTSRASLEKSAETVRQLFEAKDPRDLFALTAKSQENFESLLAYGRELFSIAAGARLDFGSAAPVAVPQLAAVPAVAAAPVETVVEVQAEAAEPEPEPIAEPTPIAKAVGKAVKSAAPEPVSAPLSAPAIEAEPLEVSGIEPVEASPPPKAAKAKALEIVPPKAAKKK